MYCGNCGKELKSNAKFCASCGEEVSPIESESTNYIVEGVDNFIENIESNENTQDEPNKEEKFDDINEQKDSTKNNKLIDGTINNTQLSSLKDNETSDIDDIPETKKKPSKKILVIAASALAIALLSIFFIMNPTKDTESILKEIESTLASFDEYIVDNNKAEIDKIKARLFEQKEEKNYEKIEVLLADTENLKTKLQTDNSSIIDNMLNETKAKDTYKAYPDELENIKSYEEKVTTYIKDNKFISARNVLTEWNDLLTSINYSYDNYTVSVNQIDFNSFPKIKVYLSIEDKNTKVVPKNLDPGFFYVSEKDASNNKFLKQTIQKVTQLDQQEGLNINMVADVSGSMENGPIDKAKYIMTNFLEQVQFNKEDKVELTAFSSGVRTCATFTDNKELLRREISNLKTGDQTALYDALFAAVNTTAVQNGAKCVMAFTDGQDNFSKVTPDEVIQVAKRYNVPIFIIGIGSGLDNAKLQNIATSTNGLYKQINDISDMSNIYDKIYKKNKEMYLLEYEAQGSDMVGERTLKIDIQTRKEGGGTSYAFTPRLLVSTQSEVNSTDEISGLIGNYLKNYVNAINNHDYSYVESYLVPGGGVEKEVKPYIMKDIQEKLLSHEIINKEFKDANTCIVTTRETYEVQNHDDPLHMRVLEGKYEVKKQSDGKWKILNFADLYKVISTINY
ncbi:VWA domain-containing protein [Clostridium sp. UBA1652]|uniref:VWA domain-containing protein n=1 Tax=Clostridium sp. UBA1652 TaxID=1946348 RepID=UPI00257AB651|nr:VWA domain-containing protein [Clostridium sp. UBA1652]